MTETSATTANAAIRTALAVADWRKTTFDLYRRIRDTRDPQAAHTLWRETRDTMFADHAASPLLPEDAATFDGLPVPNYDPAWRFVLPVQPSNPEHRAIDTGTDGTVHFDRIGHVRVPSIGTLDVWAHAGYGGGIFIPVRDASAGKARGTYGGGRYLLDTAKGADLGTDDDATLVIDFNFAYNPSCAYDPAWSCPLPSDGNTVNVAIPVGEQHDF